MSNSINLTNGNGDYAIISLDEYPENPREFWDRDTVIVYDSDRYVLGDERVDAETYSLPDNVYAFPVYAYIHSGIALSISRSITALDPQGWDSGLSGYIYIPQDRVKNIDQAYEICAADIEEFASYLSGDVYTIAIYTAAGELVENTCGFYGYANAEREAQYMLGNLQRAAQEKPRQLSLFAEEV